MSLTKISEPLKTATTIVDSPVIASRSQARYEFLRDDHGNAVAATSAGGTGTIFNFVGDVTSDFVVGDVMFVKATLPTFSGLATVLTSVFGASTDVETTVDLGFDGSTVVSELNNLTRRANYRVKFTITDNGTSAALIDNLFYAPKQTGVLIVDLQEAFVFANEGANSRQLKIVALETWTGSTGDSITLTAIQSILSHLQIQSSKGSNLVNFLLALQAVSLEGVQDETGTASLLAAGVDVGDGGPPSNLLNVASLIP